jgi:hypothetical protein
MGITGVIRISRHGGFMIRRRGGRCASAGAIAACEVRAFK